MDVPGNTMFEKMQYFQENCDGIRKLLLREPRGYPAQNVDLILAPTQPEAAAGYIIMEHVEYPPMSGHNTICTATVLLETGMVPMIEPVTHVTLEAPAGLIKIEAECSNGRVTGVTFENQPAFAVHLDVEIDVPEIGKVTVDVAYGGMWYVITDVERLGYRLVPEEGRKLARVGEMIKAAAREQLPVTHPLNPDISGISIIVLRGSASVSEDGTPNASARNTVVVSTGTLDWEKPETWTGALDRSPCGSGTSATMAVLHAKGQLALNEDFVHESIIGTKFVGRLVAETQVGQYAAVVPTIKGRAWITAHTSIVLDPTDPFPEGFTVGDIW